MYQDGGSFAEGYAIGRDSNGNGGFGGFGNDGWWGIILLALLFGWGRNGNGSGFGGGNCGCNDFSYQLGQMATTKDVASGFSTSEIMSDLNDIILGQAQGFAGVQQTLCQGFSGVNSSINQGINSVNQGLCTLGYNIQSGFNATQNQIAQCCCDLKTMNLENRYLNEKQTCDIVNAINAGNQRLIDIYNNDKISALQTENATLKSQISNNAQSQYIISQLKQPCPIPAYTVPNPNCCYNTCGGCNNF